MNIAMNIADIFAPRLLAGVGAVALVAGVGLFASSRPARSVGGPIPVTVANATVATRPTDVAAPSQPFQAVTQYVISDGFTQGKLDTADGETDIAVPAGKRLVIQTISLHRYAGTNSQSVHAFVQPISNGRRMAYSLPLVEDTGDPYPGVIQAVTLYNDGGSALTFTPIRSGFSGTEFDVFTVSGYLVDAK